jgi:hypothetical protein
LKQPLVFDLFGLAQNPIPEVCNFSQFRATHFQAKRISRLDTNQSDPEPKAFLTFPETGKAIIRDRGE